MSLPFELARQCLREPERFAPGTLHAVKLIGTHAVDPWKFNSEAVETVDTGEGALRAAHFSARRKVRDVEETMDIWLGMELHWMPIRIRMVDRNGSVIDSILQKHTIR